VAVPNNWYVAKNNQPVGPLTAKQLKEMVDEGEVLPTDMIWREGIPNWVQAQTVKGLFEGGKAEAGGLRLEEEKQPSSSSRLKSQAPGQPTSGVQPPASSPALGDIRPLLPRTQTNAYSKAEAIRDQVYAYFAEACERLGAQPLLINTMPFVVPVGLRFECWVPHPDDSSLRDRSSVVLTIHPHEYHWHEYSINIEMEDNFKTRRYTSVVDFGPQHADLIVRHLLRRTRISRPSFGFTRLRRHWWQFWRASNPATRLGGDWMAITARVLMILVVTFPFGLGLYLWCRSRRAYVISSGKPDHEPRNLARLDSWTTLVPQVGPKEEQVRKALDAALKESADGAIHISTETIRQWGVDGTEERRHITARLRRAEGFVHLSRQGDDLFVGWDTHVNSGTWAEEEIGTGIDPKTGALCRLMTIVAGWRAPDSYDLIDAISLSEWIHGAIVKVVKQVIKENNVEHEIDFRIVRRSREGIVEGPPESGGFLSWVMPFWQKGE
jgi:hypothetical protein